MSPTDTELQRGVADLVSRLAHAKLEIIDRQRWLDRTATYFVIWLTWRSEESAHRHCSVRQLYS